jgi:hypothetical protein
MPDLYDDLVAFRPATASELLPAGTAERVVRDLGAARRRRTRTLAAAGSVLVVVATLVVWQIVPHPSSPVVAATPTAGATTGGPSPTPAPSTQRAVVVRAATPLSATTAPRPIGDRRVATSLLMLQVDGQPLRLCVGGVLNSYPPQCSGSVFVAGVDWDQITWKEKAITTTTAVVDVVGVLSGAGVATTLTVEQIGPAGSFVVTSDSPVPGFTAPTMSCVRTSDLGGASAEGSDVESVSGYQGAWNDGRRFNVATLADPATVEKQVRALGYTGPLCIGTLDAPVYSELVAAQQALVHVEGLETISVSLDRYPHVDVRLIANTPGLTDQIQALVRSVSPTGKVTVSAEFLAIT